ncbi:hypothetical protein N7523_001314 [Penicillium sp. IBT 18751x]|nr:hypothetical protein N7523_001314 [Penicillium sp. IBT 18751x]
MFRVRNEMRRGNRDFANLSLVELEALVVSLAIQIYSKLSYTCSMIPSTPLLVASEIPDAPN